MNYSLLYPYALFLHVLGSMALVAFYGLEWATLVRLRRLSDGGQVLEALSPMRAGQVLVAMAGPVLFLSGLYMSWVAWGWLAPWIVTGFAAMVLLAVLGGSVTGKHVQALIASEGADLPARLPSMWTSFVVRISVLVGTIFLMCAKPGLVGSLAAMAISLVVGKWSARRLTQPSAVPSA